MSTAETEAPPPPPPGNDVHPVNIEEEMRRSYLDYAMSVIVSRALPDVRDGLKPVHRRILFSMNESGFDWNKPYRKSARVVGEVMGKYHPHGDQAIYEAMVRMAQVFSMRLPLLDGQGNFGSMDGDPPAAMRYTEIRMAQTAHALLEDIGKNTVDFQDNYDSTAREPRVLPARIPNLLVNGAGGIAVGMATNIPPHNLTEVIDACCAYVDDSNVTVEDLMVHVQGPDFPTGGIIMGRAGIRDAFKTGRGSVTIRGKAKFEEAQKSRTAIVVSEIPFQVNKSRLVEQIADLARSRRIEGIADLRDESDRDGVRVVIEVGRDVNEQVVLNQLYRYTPLQTNFGVNMLALDHGRPGILNLKEMIAAFVAFREEVITRRTKHDLGKARERAQVLVGLAIAVANIDEVIALIRKAKDPATARAQLLSRDWPAADVESLIALIDEPGRGVFDKKYRLSEGQARAILDLRLQRLTALGRDEIGDELEGLAEKILDHLDILRSRERLMAILREELVEMRGKFGTPRRTAIEQSLVLQDEEDLIQREEMVLTLSHTGYVKRVPLSTYRAQRRGGKGRSGMSTREEDFVAKVFVVNTHTPLLFFSTAGKVYTMKTYRLPQGTPQARGKPVINLLPLAEGESIATILPLPEDEASWGELTAVFATAQGIIRPINLGKFDNVRTSGIVAIKLAAGDRLIEVATATDADDILLAARSGKCLRFAIEGLRIRGGRATAGVRGMKLASGDEVISMSVLRHVKIDVEERDAYLRYASARRKSEGDAKSQAPDSPLAPELLESLAENEQFILSITENGYGKRTSSYEYRITARGGQGIINIETSERNGPVVAAGPVSDNGQIMLVTDAGKLIRSGVGDIRIASRNTQGVTLFKTAEGEKVVSAAWLIEPESDSAPAGPVPKEGADTGPEEGVEPAAPDSDLNEDPVSPSDDDGV